MSGRWESAICMVSGFVAGGLIGFNGFMWSQSVIVEVYAFSVASLMIVMLCLLRWIYAPHQRRYLYWALFFHGICFTNHQTLIVAAMGIEVAIAAANYRMGRYLFLGNSIIYLCGLNSQIAAHPDHSRTKPCGIRHLQRGRDLFHRRVFLVHGFQPRNFPRVLPGCVPRRWTVLFVSRARVRILLCAPRAWLFRGNDQVRSRKPGNWEWNGPW